MGSRYNYDINKTTRYIDIHKQFQGGLKTVDTDDALKDIYLREAENVSLSEFNFIEKRYGLHQNAAHKPWESIESASSKLQGYFEYYVDANTVHKIIAFEGRFYINQGNGWQVVQLFDSPDGTAIDLSSLGIYTNQNIVGNFLSSSLFGTQIPMYNSSTSSPNGSLSGEIYTNKIVHFANNQVWRNSNGSTSWTLLGTSAFPFNPLAGIVQGTIRKDIRTNYLLRWDNPTGVDGQFTLVNATYDADFQTTRPIEGVRIEDKLYIATGTYPVYYKGDGKIYVFPQYKMSSLDVQNLSYDLNNVGLESAMFNDIVVSKTSSHGLVDEENESYEMKDRLFLRNNVLSIKEAKISPLIPYVIPSTTGQTSFKFAYHLYNNSNKDFYNGFDSEATKPSGWQTLYGKLVETSANNWRPYQVNNEYLVKVSIERKLAGTLDSFYEAVELNENIVLTSDASAPLSKRLPQSSTDALSNILVNLNNDISGNYNFRIKLSLIKKGYKAVLVNWSGVSDTAGSDLWDTAPTNRKLNITSAYGETFATNELLSIYLNDNLNAWASAYGAQDTDGTVVARADNGSGGFVYATYTTIVNDFREGDDFSLQYPFFTSSTDPDNISEVVLAEAYYEFTDVFITPEKLEDFSVEPISNLEGAVHSCNRIGEHFGRLMLWGNPNYPTKLFFSTAGAKEYFPYFYMLDFSNDLQEGINVVTKYQNVLIVQSNSYTWGLKGSVPLLLDPLEGTQMEKFTVNPTIGCIAPNSVKNIRNQLFFLSKEGVFSLRTLYAEDLRYNVDPIDRNIYNIVPRDSDAICAYYDDQYWLHFPQSGETLRYYVEKKAWVKDTYSAWNLFGGVFKYINDSGVLRFITHLSQLEEEEDLQVFDIDVDYSLPTDLGKNITSRMTTSYLNQNYPFHPKNYKEAKFDFAIQNEYNASLDEIPLIGEPIIEEFYYYVQFDVSLIERHFYSITFQPNEVKTLPVNYIVSLDDEVVLEGSFIADGDNLLPIEFMSKKTGVVTIKIEARKPSAFGYSPGFTSNLSADSIVLYDSTYDHTVTFNTMVLSEEGTLNIDPIESYTSADVAIPIDLGTRTGNWTFGTSNFGNVIVAVKTVKLAGRGYNAKISIIEDSKSKWTLESLGITYKMKKARSK